MVGRDLANAFNFKLGDHIHLTGDIYPGDFEFTVRGIFDSPRASQVMYMNKEYIDQSMGRDRAVEAWGYITSCSTTAKNSVRIASTQWTSKFRNAPPYKTKTESEQAFTVGFLNLSSATSKSSWPPSAPR